MIILIISIYVLIGLINRLFIGDVYNTPQAKEVLRDMPLPDLAFKLAELVSIFLWPLFVWELLFSKKDKDKA